MEKPDFTMSMYSSEEDLYKAKAEYYESECARLEHALTRIYCDPSAVTERCCARIAQIALGIK